MGFGDMLQAKLDAEDAKRYRHLRDHTGNTLMRKLMKLCQSKDWDKIIDAEMTTRETGSES